MRNFWKILGLIALVAVIGFSMAACSSSSDDDHSKEIWPGGGLSGAWVDDDYSGNTIKFSGSNYTITDANGSEISSGTYTLTFDGKDIAYYQTSPTPATYKGYYFHNKEPRYLTFEGNTYYYKQ